VDRREFLKTSGAIGAGMMLPMTLLDKEIDDTSSTRSSLSYVRNQFQLIAEQPQDEMFYISGYFQLDKSIDKYYLESGTIPFFPTLKDFEVGDQLYRDHGKGYWFGSKEIIDEIFHLESEENTWIKKVVRVSLQELTTKPHWTRFKNGSQRDFTIREKIYHKDIPGFITKTRSFSDGQKRIS
jgi:hypothetical protein